jgi:hypothetical protein
MSLSTGLPVYATTQLQQLSNAYCLLSYALK